MTIIALKENRVVAIDFVFNFAKSVHNSVFCYNLNFIY